jgi:hypothetical protein
LARNLDNEEGEGSPRDTTRIDALHDRFLSSQTVKNTSQLTYDDDRGVRIQ